ncbi:MAG: response regulator [Verrucomicrobiota bacterium]|nr:response regulator [Verrucomicrobiota bacterium]MDE3067903.1 response regulator [Verrucomicrobiota bacterium]
MKKCVLIVDDDVSIRESMKRVLEGAGYEVLLAASGQEGIDQFALRAVDLLILDLNLPIRRGWDVFEELTHVDPFMPIIVITGLTNQFKAAMAAGAGALLEKPVDPVVLLKTMADLLGEPNEQHLQRLCGYTRDTRYVPAPKTSRRRNKASGEKNAVAVASHPAQNRKK